MPFARMFRIDLGRSVVLLAVLATFAALAIGLYASFQVQRQMLIDSTLEANRVYATKLADITEEFFANSRQQLGYSSGQISSRFGDDQALQDEARRIRMQVRRFDTVLVVDASGVVRAASPASRYLKGERLDNPGSREALQQRRALVSAPYVSSRDHLTVFISQPVFDPAGKYLGYIGGAVHLKRGGALSALLGEHFYKDGSYIYVVDRERRLLYHPQLERLGTVVGANPVIDAVLWGQNGSRRLINSQGMDMLAGYAMVPSSGWGVVAQRPTEVTLRELDGLMLEVLGEIAPMALLTLLLVGLLASLLVRPLRQLAGAATELDAPEALERLRRVRSWYFEAAQFRRALLIGASLLHQKIGKLNLEVQLDPLTGLRNRRGLTASIEQLRAEQQPFAVIDLDIDHFRQLNDNLGHERGDALLREVAEQLRNCAGPGDLPCRCAGDEFLLLLPEADAAAASRVAERLRQAVEALPPGPLGGVTLSLGVAAWPAHGESPEEVFKQADEALQRARQAGGNRLAVAGDAP